MNVFQCHHLNRSFHFDCEEMKQKKTNLLPQKANIIKKTGRKRSDNSIHQMLMVCFNGKKTKGSERKRKWKLRNK